MQNKKYFVFVLTFIKYMRVLIMIKILEVLSTFKNKKIKINNILIEKYKDMLENPNFEKNHYSKISTGIYKTTHDSIRLKKWICYCDRSQYENLIYYDLMGNVSSCLSKIS